MTFDNPFSSRIPGTEDTDTVKSDVEDDEESPIHFKAKESVSAADIKLRIDGPPSADNAVEVTVCVWTLKKMSPFFQQIV